MTQIHHPAYLLIEDQLDAIGQKYRVVCLVRGAMLFLGVGLLVSLAAALVAHLAGEGWGSRLVLTAWIAWTLASLGLWIVRPLLIRPEPVQVARLVEQRIEGLHNGLTNSVLLARATDLRDSPFLPHIFDEVLTQTRSKSLDQAVRFADLKPLGMRLGAAVGLAIVIAVLFPAPFAHGWRQMFSPGGFVPQQGEMVIESVLPGDVTLVAGQPLEISIIAYGPHTPEAVLIFDTSRDNAVLAPTPHTADRLLYTYRADFIDQSLRYRVEVGSSQSPWYRVTVVPDVKLRELTLDVTPPAYTGIARAVTRLTPDQLTAAPLAVPQGSRIDATFSIDVPMGGALLQLGDASPQAMRATTGGEVFTASFNVLSSTTFQALLTSPSGQITSALPQPPLPINAIIDAPPTIELRWPTANTTVAPDAEIKLAAILKDDYALTSARVLMSTSADAPLTVVHQQPASEKLQTLEHVLDVPADVRAHGRSISIQIEAVDNRALTAQLGADGGPQTTRSGVIEIKFSDPQQIAQEMAERQDRLRARLMEMLKRQQDLLSQSIAFQPMRLDAMAKILSGQVELRRLMIDTAETSDFDQRMEIIRKTLLVLATGPAKDAIELAAAVGNELVEAERLSLNTQLQGQQRRIISTLESLIALLETMPEGTLAQASRPGGDLPTQADVLKKLNEDLKQFMAEQQRILDQTAALAKKPVDDWDDTDRKLLEDLLQAQEKLDAFMQQKVNDFSKLAEQDMANSSLLRELMEVYSEVTMAKDALNKQAIELAVSLEESGLELAEEITSNLEKWLMEEPDRIKWTMEDPIAPLDVPMPELPTELEDMIGELMEQQEDLFEEIEDTNANWTDALDKGAGWDAVDGPIANMTAKGVTGNQLPNDNEMGGRSGEGRSGKSQGEFVEETASGKGGRNTPTRLDPTAFQQGQIKDTSTDPVGGATGGGKISGQGGEGLEGPVPNQRDLDLQRLAQKQAQIRNTAERINLQFRLGRYDNFKLLESIAIMRRIESDLQANRYQTALRRRDILLEKMDTSRLLAEGQIHVQQDTTPTPSSRLEEQIHDTMRGDLPPAWEGALKTYYEKLGRE